MKTDNEIRDLAINTLVGVCEDADAPSAAKAQAARTLAEIINLLGKNSAGDGLAEKSLSDMTAQELDREIMRLSRGAKD